MPGHGPDGILLADVCSSWCPPFLLLLKGANIDSRDVLNLAVSSFRGAGLYSARAVKARRVLRATDVEVIEFLDWLQARVCFVARDCLTGRGRGRGGGEGEGEGKGGGGGRKRKRGGGRRRGERERERERQREREVERARGEWEGERGRERGRGEEKESPNRLSSHVREPTLMIVDNEVGAAAAGASETSQPKK